jgi:ribosomal protein L37E
MGEINAYMNGYKRGNDSRGIFEDAGCSRCGNEEIKSGQSYCQICGHNLKNDLETEDEHGSTKKSSTLKKA